MRSRHSGTVADRLFLFDDEGNVICARPKPLKENEEDEDVDE